MATVNALSADRLMSKHFEQAEEALTLAQGEVTYPRRAAVHLQIAEAHVRLAELAASIRVHARP